MLASVIVSWPVLLQLLCLSLYAPVWLLAGASTLSGAGIAMHLALWFTVFQQNVPAESLSRVSSYDSFGSFVLLPLGAALAGPVAAVVGVQETLIGAAVVIAISEAIVFAQPSVHAIRAREEPEPPTDFQDPATEHVTMTSP